MHKEDRDDGADDDDDRCREISIYTKRENWVNREPRNFDGHNSIDDEVDDL